MLVSERTTVSALRLDVLVLRAACAGIAAGRRYRHHVEGGAGSAIERAADRAVERLLVGDVGPVEADHHQRLTAGDRGRRRGDLLRRRVGESAVVEALAVELAVLDRERQHREVAPLVADVVALPADILAEVVEQAVDQHHGAIAVVLEDGELPVILVDRALQPVGGAYGFEDVSRERRVARRGIRDRVEARDVVTEPAERGLRLASTAAPAADCRAWCRPAGAN